jgi:hypothetical protein
MVCPLFSYVQPEREEQAFAQLIKDRISQLRGNEPYSLQPFTPDGNNPIGWLAPIHLAVKKGHDKILRLLIERDLDCNEKDSDGITPGASGKRCADQGSISSLLGEGQGPSECCDW